MTKQSGRRFVVVMRQVCNGRLRNAVYHWARVAVTRDRRTTEVYALLRARGQSHGRALRSVADRLLHLLIVMLKSGTLFDPLRWAHEAPATPATEIPAAPAPEPA